MQALVMLLVLSDVALASAVFIALARPDVVIAFSLRHMGMGELWFEEHLGAEELGRLRRVVRLASYVGLLALLAWSFMVGVLMTLAQLSA